MKVKVVTGYIPLPVRNMSVEQFRANGKRLLDCLPCPVTVFDEPDIDGCWAKQFLDHLHLPLVPSANNVPADRFPSPAVMAMSNIIQNQKSEWLFTAASKDSRPDVFVWIDYGIFKQQPMKEQEIVDFIHKLEAQDSLDEIVAPGIHPQPVDVDPGEFCDRFCGSVTMVPSSLVSAYHDSMVSLAQALIRASGKIEWEVNYIARLEHIGILPLRQYRCWWDGSQFTNYGSHP